LNYRNDSTAKRKKSSFLNYNLKEIKMKNSRNEIDAVLTTLFNKKD